MDNKAKAELLKTAVILSVTTDATCLCENCCAMRDAAIKTLDNAGIAGLTDMQASQVAHDIDMLRLNADPVPPRSLVAAQLRELGCVPSANPVDIPLVLSACAVFGVEVSRAAITNNLKHIMTLEFAQRIARILEAAADKRPGDPNAEKWVEFAGRLLMPEVDDPASDAQMRVRAITPQASALIVELRTKGARGEIAGLSAQAQERLRLYSQFCGDGRGGDPIKMLDIGSYQAVREALALYTGEADQAVKDELTELFAYIDHAVTQTATPLTTAKPAQA